MYENKEYASYLDTFRAWLSAAGNNDPELETCAALAIGNFACNETHCTELVSNGTSITLIQLLGMRQNSFEHLKLQHALLGALKNLAVAPSSRLILLEQGKSSFELKFSLASKLRCTLEIWNHKYIHNLFRPPRTMLKSGNDYGTRYDESTSCVQIISYLKIVGGWT